MKITACPKCGSTDISAGTMNQGVTFGVTSWTQTCKNCNYRGQPIILDSEKDYKKFLENLKNKSKKSDKETEIDECLSDNDKRIVDCLKEYEKEKESKPVWPKNKRWWPEIIIALIFSLYANVAGIGDIASYMGYETAAIYSVFNFVAIFVITLLMIVIFEYIVLFSKNLVTK